MESLRMQGVGSDEKIAGAMQEYQKLYAHWTEFAERTGEKVRESMLKAWEDQKGKYNVWLDISKTKGIDLGKGIDYKQMVDKSIGDMKNLTGQMIPKDIGKKVEFPKESFENWIRNYTETVEIVLKSPAFVSLLGVMLDSTLDMKKKNDEMMADIIRSLGLPSRKDMDALYKRVHELTQKINIQSQTIKKLKKGA